MQLKRMFNLFCAHSVCSLDGVLATTDVVSLYVRFLLLPEFSWFFHQATARAFGGNTVTRNQMIKGTIRAFRPFHTSAGVVARRNPDIHPHLHCCPAPSNTASDFLGSPRLALSGRPLTVPRSNLSTFQHAEPSENGGGQEFNRETQHHHHQQKNYPIFVDTNIFWHQYFLPQYFLCHGA